MSKSLRRLFPELQIDPRVGIGWAVVILVIGILLGIQPGWIAFVMFLPATLTGLQTIFLRPDKPDPLATLETAAASAKPDLPAARVQQLVHDLQRAASALAGLSDQPMSEQAAVITRAARTLDEFNDMADRSRREAAYLSVIARQTTTVSKSGQDALSA